ncbi:GroES-like protein [Polychaeton citri CBS 116435]|uniref:GroES-like protein n=1 Tax=Polychaeton citri CBS 116435 TaxID=1314669 RepID=A0A9P4QEE3_9PEZI|nr:GroES-like protein [Polychaeton citri CBS 116435]
MAQNRTAFLDGAAQRLRVDDTPVGQPGPDEVLIKNHALAINPVDYKVQDSGFFVRNWPFVLGCDVAGEVEAVGSNVTAFKPGDRVIGHAVGLIHQEHKYGGFNKYTVVPAAITAKVPSSIAYTDAATLPLAIETAAVGLYRTEPGFLGLPYPSLSPKDLGKTILVWGGASSVGIQAIQLAVASGARVITTASPRNFELVKRAGASEVFDYNSASVVSDVVTAVKKQGTFGGVYDAIALAPSFEKEFEVIQKLGGGPVAASMTLPKTLPEGIIGGEIAAFHEATHPVWKDYITAALEAGKLLCLPPADIVGQGLESVQHAVDLMKKGVNGKKLVVEV